MLKRLLAAVFVMLLLAGLAGAERLTDEELVSFYDGAVFVGDSVPRLLRNYIVPIREKDPSFFRDVRFYTAYDYKLGTAAREMPSPTKVNIQYKGSDIAMCRLAEKLKPEKLFILAGLNDRIEKNIDRGMEYVEKIMTLLAKYAPDTQVYFFSLTPVTAKENSKGIQTCIDDYNAALELKCGELGAVYIDIATGLKNEDGVMDKSISSDGKYHLNSAGNAIWVQLLLDFAQQQYDLGLWAPGGEEI